MKLSYPPPSRVWFPTGEGWATRDWNSGERDEYARDVLGWKNAHTPGKDEPSTVDNRSA